MIQDNDVKEAFLYFLGVAATSTRYTCHAQWKGEVRDFRFHDASGEQPHSFITTRQWLLFHFRPLSLRGGFYTREALETDFDSFEETPAGEWHIKIRSIDDVHRLSRHVRWKAS